jgi:hypothetical protein
VSERTQPAKRAALAAAAALSAAFVPAVLLDLAPWLRGPAPYPPEWQWEYRFALAPAPLAALALMALVLVLLGATGLPALRRRAHGAGLALVAASVLLGFALPLALLAREPTGALRALLARTTSFSVTSYHTAAVSDAARDPLAFVRRHAELLPELARTAKHAATHPVGPVLLFRAAVAVCERSPALTELLLDAADVPERDFVGPLTRPARAGALLGALVLCLLAALTAWPLAALAEALGLGPLAAARVSLLWTLLPGPALIEPRFDASIALPVVAFAALFASAAHAPGAAAFAGRAALAGACAGAALLLSYGSAAFLAVAVLAVLAAARAEGRRGTATAVAAVAGALVATAIAVTIAFGLPALVGGHPIDALRAALAIHREAYTAPRSYWLWLLFDPIDFGALLGVGVASLAVAGTWRTARERLTGRRTGPAAAFGLVVVAATFALVLTGVARGEVGRIWIPLMPLALIAASSELERDGAGETTLVGLLTALSTLALAAAWKL